MVARFLQSILYIYLLLDFFSLLTDISLFGIWGKLFLFEQAYNNVNFCAGIRKDTLLPFDTSFSSFSSSSSSSDYYYHHHHYHHLHHHSCDKTGYFFITVATGINSSNVQIQINGDLWNRSILYFNWIPSSSFICVTICLNTIDRPHFHYVHEVELNILLI